ncbi:hypothetical protein GEMRC1_007584 [Eukaryota sp. GEM-RC1]
MPFAPPIVDQIKQIISDCSMNVIFSQSSAEREVISFACVAVDGSALVCSLGIRKDSSKAVEVIIKSPASHLGSLVFDCLQERVNSLKGEEQQVSQSFDDLLSF